jgi:hypothetical protein
LIILREAKATIEATTHVTVSQKLARADPKTLGYNRQKSSSSRAAIFQRNLNDSIPGTLRPV